uniref:Uncharacterized protein n=1 Tax=Daphnia magna TaxID=35525 RepID=A0A0P5VYJ4_9CRUS
MLWVSNLFVFRFDSSVCVFILIQIESGKAECSRRPIYPLTHSSQFPVCTPRPWRSLTRGRKRPKRIVSQGCVVVSCVY